MKIRIQDIDIYDEERPRRVKDNPKKRGRIQVEEEEFPQKKKPSRDKKE